MNKRERIQKKIRELQGDLRELNSELRRLDAKPTTVQVPNHLESLFSEIEQRVATYFEDTHHDAECGEITVFGERYVLLRTASLSYEFIHFIRERYSDYKEDEAISIGNNFLYDNAKVIGKKDAIAFTKRLDLKDAMSKLAAGPIHFAFTGWANVEILPESNPVETNDFLLRFKHHNSFEAQAWIKAGIRSHIPVCTMNSGYSAGWCEESFGIPLTTVELTCEARGDEYCSFITAPSHRIEAYVSDLAKKSNIDHLSIPVFFQRKKTEEKLKESIQQKEVLIQEIHHRVKNNLQVIISLLRLQMDKMNDPILKNEFSSTLNRIKIMASVHELMYRSDNFSHLSLKSYLQELMDSLVQLYALDEKVEVRIQLEDIGDSFSLEHSIPLSLLLNEITCNAFKHGLKDGGTFYVELTRSDDGYQLVIGDSGPGLDAEVRKDGLGLMLIDVLADQMDASIEERNSKNGLEYKINFSLT